MTHLQAVDVQQRRRTDWGKALDACSQRRQSHGHSVCHYRALDRTVRKGAQQRQAAGVGEVHEQARSWILSLRAAAFPLLPQASKDQPLKKARNVSAHAPLVRAVSQLAESPPRRALLSPVREGGVQQLRNPPDTLTVPASTAHKNTSGARLLLRLLLLQGSEEV